ncbi:hypothetical protein SRABI80_04902 [Peribacillus frigoritolerans]|nr:hypothetical protein SRABI80_04902 [Peribacillus frigoritolerans]
MNPALKPNPAVHWKVAAIANDIPVNKACTTNRAGATNMKANSKGSVTPVKNEAKPAASINEATCFFFRDFAEWYMARAAAGKPNIMTGKKPA